MSLERSLMLHQIFTSVGCHDTAIRRLSTTSNISLVQLPYTVLCFKSRTVLSLNFI